MKVRKKKERKMKGERKIERTLRGSASLDQSGS